MQKHPFERVYKKKEVREILGNMSTGSFHTLVKSGQFPKGAPIGSAKVLKWTESDIRTYLDRCLSQRGGARK